MIVYHYPENRRKIIIPRLLKPCTGLDNSATYHEDKLWVSMLKKDANIAKRANKIITNELMLLNKIKRTNTKSQSSGIQICNNT